MLLYFVSPFVQSTNRLEGDIMNKLAKNIVLLVMLSVLCLDAYAGRRHDSKYERVREDVEDALAVGAMAWGFLSGISSSYKRGNLTGHNRTYDCEGNSRFSTGRYGSSTTPINGDCVYRDSGPSGKSLNFHR